MKQYPKYKSTDIINVAKIPEDWKTLKLRLVCDSVFTGNTPVYSLEQNDCLVFGQRNNQKVGIDFCGIKYADPNFFASRSEYEFLQYGDVLLNTLGGGSVGRIGFYNISGKRVITDGHVMILRGSKLCTQKYLYYFLYSQQRFLEEAAVGSTNQAFLTTSQLYQWKVAVPSKQEQETITRFLDSKTAKIDESVSLLEAQKADLQEYRKAIISETVTRGLNPNAKLKDSGIQWIGMIPEKWKIVPLKYLLSSNMEYGANESAETPVEGWPRYIRITDIADNGKLRDETYMSLSPDKAADYMLKKGDILFARSGATVGKTYLFDEDYPACFAGYLIKATCGEKLLPSFLSLYTQSSVYDNWKNSIYIQSTIQNIGADKYSQMPVPVPSIPEQQKIVDESRTKMAQIDESILRIDEQIAGLKEYCMALITEAVTGKIDVR